MGATQKKWVRASQAISGCGCGCGCGRAGRVDGRMRVGVGAGDGSAAADGDVGVGHTGGYRSSVQSVDVRRKLPQRLRRGFSGGFRIGAGGHRSLGVCSGARCCGIRGPRVKEVLFVTSVGIECL